MSGKEVPILWLVVGDPLAWDKAPGRYFSTRYRDQVKSFTAEDGRKLTAIPLLWLDHETPSKGLCAAETTKLLLRSRARLRILSDTNGELIYHRVSAFIETPVFVQMVAEMLGQTIENWWDEEIERKTAEIRSSWSDKEIAQRSAPCDQIRRADTQEITDYRANFENFDDNSI